ncbi:hypothetical protein HRR83_008177 [Exophiala dermatitidis]|nr:hypothetical protein HRR74_007868 [Exophiala dermatitidis]KAJ4513607.1 hypothetical protein HRR73_005765 [Exophiala dermatitidis]KAJ4535549.1 hypothetical protein HRR77_007868 [Exophiala dermatitidis]KAJ4544473.1 hypothetical protein HRR76_002532 [Exophiala dermatitidis]KAJ4564999.1 hypothetical protein HRR81_007964 [Exophiala dermatitidis]
MAREVLYGRYAGTGSGHVAVRLSPPACLQRPEFWGTWGTYGGPLAVVGKFGTTQTNPPMFGWPDRVDCLFHLSAPLLRKRKNSSRNLCRHDWLAFCALERILLQLSKTTLLLQ